MKMLAQDRYEKAVHFLQHDARPLEQALYAYQFTGGSAESVLTALAAFQNADGGFGHGLECDIRLNDSSVIATTIAFQRFRQLHTPANHPMVKKACDYLIQTYDAERLNWPIMPPNIDDAPHAPWWMPGGDLEKSMSNPRAEIAGYLNDYSENFPADMRDKVTQSVVAYLITQPDTMEMHDLACYINFSESPKLPDATRAALLDKLKRIVSSTVERNPENWKNYGLPPLNVIASPDSPFADLFRDEIEPNLDFIIDAQGEDGTWQPNWSWGMWPEAWEQAKREWIGVMTLGNLTKLRTFKRLA